jgi:hypothetical protein
MSKVKKQVIIGYVNRKETKNEKIFIGDLYLDDLMAMGDFKSGQFKTVWNTDSIKSLTIAIFENDKGEIKRRIAGGLDHLTTEQGLASFKELAKSLGVTITRALEIHTGGKP